MDLETDSERNARLSEENGGQLAVAIGSAVGRGATTMSGGEVSPTEHARHKLLERAMVGAIEGAWAEGVFDEEAIKDRKAIAYDEALEALNTLGIEAYVQSLGLSE